MNRSRALLLSLFVLSASTEASQRNDDASTWSRFRGPNGSGVADVGNLPDELGPEKNVLWRRALPPGHSSPVLWDARIFLTAIEDETLWVFCLEQESGEVLWQTEAPRERTEKYDGRNNPASPSPVVDRRVVVVFLPDFGLLAYDHDGGELWRMELGPFDNVYGMGASPVLHGDTLLLACDQATGSYFLAVDKTSGKELWKVDRPEAKSGHCTPILREGAGGVTEALLPGSFFLTAYDVATGAKRWWVGGLSFEMKSVPILSHGLVFTNGYGSPMNQPGNQLTVPAFDEVLGTNDANADGTIGREEMPESKASAWFDFVDLAADGKLDREDWEYLAAALASQNGMLAIRPGETGDVTETNVAWAYRRSVPQLPSPIVYADVLYMLNDSGGLITTFEPASGEVIERGRIEDATDTFYASPVAGDGKVYIVSEHGLVIVLPAGGSLEPLSLTDLGERVYATPALSEGRIFLRSEDALYCFGDEARHAQD